MKVRKYIKTIGTGQGIYFTNDDMKAYKLKKGDLVECDIKRLEEWRMSFNNYEMYEPKNKKHFNLKIFLRNYIYFRIQHNIKPYLMQFLLIFIIGFVLNYAHIKNKQRWRNMGNILDELLDTDELSEEEIEERISSENCETV